MQCPRLRHFVRLDASGKIGKCGHMTKAKTFDSVAEMQQSDWLRKIEKTMKEGKWPAECVRCEMTEDTSGTSIRLDMIERDRMLKAIKKDYLIVGGVLDNICNSACQSCNETLSTKIGSLKSRDYQKINNFDNFFSIPQQRIIELDINGGEPTASPNYKKLLRNLPQSVKIVRLNTNVSRLVPEVVELLEKGTRVIVTMSFDGVGSIHNYVRWPILWNDYRENVIKYLELRKKFSNLRLNMWTTVSSLNVGNMEQIINFAHNNKIDHSYGFCLRPSELDIRYQNKLTIDAKTKLNSSKNKLLQAISKKCAVTEVNSYQIKEFIRQQDKIRNINFEDYFNFDRNLL